MLSRLSCDRKMSDSSEKRRAPVTEASPSSGSSTFTSEGQSERSISVDAARVGAMARPWPEKVTSPAPPSEAARAITVASSTISVRVALRSRLRSPSGPSSRAVMRGWASTAMFSGSMPRCLTQKRYQAMASFRAPCRGLRLGESYWSMPTMRACVPLTFTRDLRKNGFERGVQPEVALGHFEVFRNTETACKSTIDRTMPQRRNRGRSRAGSARPEVVLAWRRGRESGCLGGQTEGSYRRAGG